MKSGGGARGRGLLQQGRELSGEMENALQVDAHEAIPLVGFELLDRLLDLNRRVVDQDVESPEARKGDIDERRDLVRRAHVGPLKRHRQPTSSRSLCDLGVDLLSGLSG